MSTVSLIIAVIVVSVLAFLIFFVLNAKRRIIQGGCIECNSNNLFIRIQKGYFECKCDRCNYRYDVAFPNFLFIKF